LQKLDSRNFKIDDQAIMFNTLRATNEAQLGAAAFDKATTLLGEPRLDLDQACNPEDERFRCWINR
jgi:hypothetical protein